MKNSLYVIAALLIIIWFIVFLTFNASGYVHIILGIALIIILVRIMFDKRLSGKS